MNPALATTDLHMQNDLSGHVESLEGESHLRHKPGIDREVLEPVEVRIVVQAPRDNEPVRQVGLIRPAWWRPTAAA
jgi:hypothetical protein